MYNANSQVFMTDFNKITTLIFDFRGILLT